MHKNDFVIGVDFGTDSVRSLIVDVHNGQLLATNVQYYSRWKEGLYCDAAVSKFRQHPLDYIESMEQSVLLALEEAGAFVKKNIRAISVDTTGSTPVAVNKYGMPLALLDEFMEDPDAMFILWKDHTAIKEMEEINRHAKSFDTDYLKYVGGIYSSEWYWSKLLYTLRNSDRVKKACYSWVEHCDWIPFLLTGKKGLHEMKRSVCAAGHKALWSQDWNGLPPNRFFASLDPLLDGFVSRLYTEVSTTDKCAGNLCREWAQRWGLSESVLIGVGTIDAHAGAVGGQIEPYYLSKVIGTSTCDMLVAPEDAMKDKFVPGICGLVNGSIIPGMIGMEAGQSAFGDVFAWFKDLLLWPLKRYDIDKGIIDKIEKNILYDLAHQADAIQINVQSEYGLDWLNGRRTPDANLLLKGMISNISLGTNAPKIYRALVEATCFGSKAIVDRFIECNVPVKGIIGVGGIAKKSSFVMQMLADVLDMPIRINNAEQTGALGAAMFASVVAGIHDKVETAMHVIGQGFDRTFVPDKRKVEIYKERYTQYRLLGDYYESG